MNNLRHFSALVLAVMLMMLSACSDDTEYIFVQPNTPDYRSGLAALDWGDDSVIVIGHLTPDVDAVCSAIAYADLMQKLGYKCTARLAGEMNREMLYIKDLFGISVPQVLDSVAPQQRVILTDHSYYDQAVKGLNRANVIQIIDHHSLGDVTSYKSLFCKIMPIGSSCSVVYTSYQELQVSITDHMAKVLLAGILSDTRNLTKFHTDIDSTALTSLASQLNLDSIALDSINRRMSEASHNYYGMTDKEIYLCDIKDYTIEGVKFAIASLDWYYPETIDEFLQRMHNVSVTLKDERGAAMMFAKVDRHVPNPDITSSEPYLDEGSYVVYEGEGAKEVAEVAYGPSIGSWWVYSTVKLSRKTDLVPAITAILQKRNSKH